jgi:hypothetical protein
METPIKTVTISINEADIILQTLSVQIDNQEKYIEELSNGFTIDAKSEIGLAENELQKLNTLYKKVYKRFWKENGDIK